MYTHYFEPVPSSDSSGIAWATSVSETRFHEESSSKATAHSSIYPWAAAAELKAVQKGESVLSLEKLECSDKGNFLLVTVGRALKTHDPSSMTSTIPMVRQQFFAANNYPGTVNANRGRIAIENSVNVEHYWCIPKQEFCIQEVQFGKFGLQVRKGRTADLPAAKIYNLRLGMITALQRAVLDHCQTSTNEVAVAE